MPGLRSRHETDMNTTKHIAVVIEAGLVRAILTDAPDLQDIEVQVIDYDLCQDEPQAGCLKVPRTDGSAPRRAVVQEQRITASDLDLAGLATLLARRG